jgi:two-component system response regulator (stage 0 sporulation protein F)
MGDILVIDKDSQIRDKFSQITNRLGYNMASLSSLEEGLAAIKKQPPALVLLDCDTTSDSSIVDAVKKIRQLSRQTEIIILSGGKKHVIKEEFKGLGVWAIVKKSFFGDAMFKEILEILKGSQEGRELLSPEEKQEIMIMIVDDNLGIRATLKNFLNRKGYRVAEAESGDEAIKKVETEQPRPKIVLLDLRMPGTDGLAVLKKIQELDSGIKVIVLSSTHDPAVVKQAKDLGASDYLTKPCDLKAVDNAISLLFLKLLSP